MVHSTTLSKKNIRRTKAELEHGRISTVPIGSIRPSPENDDLYGVTDLNSQDIGELAASINEHGLREPLVVTRDGFILSGHRRRAAAIRAGLTEVPVRMLNIKRSDDRDRFVVLLREYNRQRDKSHDVKLREELVTTNPIEAHRRLREHRRNRSEVFAETFAIREERRRASISKAKGPFLQAIDVVLQARRNFWPLSTRQIHYALLNHPPLIHASKPDSVYRNLLKCYKSLVDLTTRARLCGKIPMDAIDDETRPMTTWQTWPDVRGFMRSEIDDFLMGFYRDLQQSQPNHIEIIVEKNTVLNIVKDVAADYCIPITSGRGYSSLPPRAKIARRFRMSGKDRLILLIASDFDPDGEEIAHSFARSMRDDFGINDIEPVKVALTAEQVGQFNLPPIMKAKETSSRYERFTDQHGDDVFELEAIEPETLQDLFRDAIDSVMDVEAFNAEVDAEAQDAAYLEGLRADVHDVLRSRIGGQQQ